MQGLSSLMMISRFEGERSMMSYRDFTYCPFWKTCRQGPSCSRALTQEVRDQAEQSGLLISRYGSHPNCHKEVQA